MSLNTKPFLSLALILYIQVLVCCSKDNRPQIIQSDSIKIERLLSETDLETDSSLSLSLQKAIIALNLSRKNNNSQQIIHSWLIIGNIQALKGKNNEALDTFIKVYELARQTRNLKGICIANIKIGEIYYTWGKYDKALGYFSEAKTIAETNGFYNYEALALNYLGKYFHTKGDFHKTMLYYQQSLYISKKYGDYKQIATILSDIGKYYISEGKLSQALEKYLEAYKTCDLFNDKIIRAKVCNHLGGLYLLIGQPEKSLEYHRKSLIYRDIINNPEGIAKSYNNIGRIFLDKKQTDSAFLYFYQSYKLCCQTGYMKGIVKSLTNLGKVYALQNKHDKELQVLNQAFDFATKSGYTVGIAESSLGLGNYFMNFQKTDKAIDYYLLSLEKIKKTNLYQILQGNYAGLFKCYLKKKNQEKALHYHIYLSNIEKKLLNIENNRQLAILHISFDSERKEKDNQVLRKDNELKEMAIKRKTAFIWLIIVALAFTILLCIFTYIRFYDKKKANLILHDLNIKISKQNSKLEILNKELEKANHEKDILFSIITHELRNPLFWFQNLAEVLSKKYQIMSPEKIKKTLAALDESAKNAFHLMDNLLNWSRSKLKRITPKKGNYVLFDLVSENIRMYETIIQQKELDLNLNIGKGSRVFLDPDIFNCVLRNLLSNAIKYTPAKGIIKIESIEDGTCFIITVINYGPGIPNKDIHKIFNRSDYFSTPGLMQEKGSGLGLKICMEFVELNNGKIWLSSETEKETSFSFTVPKTTSTCL